MLSLTNATRRNLLCETEIMLEAARALEAIMGDEGKIKQREETTGQGPLDRAVESTTLIGKDSIIENLLSQAEVSLVEPRLAKFQAPHLYAFEIDPNAAPSTLAPPLNLRGKFLRTGHCCCCSRVLCAFAG